MMFMQNVS